MHVTFQIVIFRSKLKFNVKNYFSIKVNGKINFVVFVLCFTFFIDPRIYLLAGKNCILIIKKLL
jgi:hypothetical protein